MIVFSEIDILIRFAFLARGKMFAWIKLHFVQHAAITASAVKNLDGRALK